MKREQLLLKVLKPLLEEERYWDNKRTGQKWEVRVEGKPREVEIRCYPVCG